MHQAYCGGLQITKIKYDYLKYVQACFGLGNPLHQNVFVEVKFVIYEAVCLTK